VKESGNNLVLIVKAFWNKTMLYVSKFKSLSSQDLVIKDSVARLSKLSRW